jgi:hypothetical protein
MSSSADKDDHDDVKLSSVTEPHENDVLLGRGGKNNRHLETNSYDRWLDSIEKDRRLLQKGSHNYLDN